MTLKTNKELEINRNKFVPRVNDYDYPMYSDNRNPTYMKYPEPYMDFKHE